MPDALGVIFDMDGVLVDSHAPHLESWRRLARELGLSVSDDAFDRAFGRTSRDIIRMLFGDGRDDNEIRDLDRRKEAIYRDLIRHDVPAMPGAVDLVRALAADGFRIAIGSSGPPENIALVESAMDLTPCLSARVTGADVSRGKPDPQVFQLAAKRMHLPPRRCVVIEDAPVGIEAAKRAGCAAVALTSTHNAAAFEGADGVVDRLSDLTPSALREWVDRVETKPGA
jgi:beta-phosphoglucomutase